jgi:Protein of unknown function (DUF2911)
MKIKRFVVLATFAIASTLFFEVRAHADEANQSTTITFTAPVEISGQVLPPGTYLFKLADSNSLNLVRVFNTDGTRLYATLQTVPAERVNPSENTVVTLAEASDERPANAVIPTRPSTGSCSSASRGTWAFRWARSKFFSTDCEKRLPLVRAGENWRVERSKKSTKASAARVV